MVDARPERGDEAQSRPRFAEHRRIDAVRHGGNQHVGLLDGGDKLRLAQGLIVEIEAGHEQLHHPRLDRVGQLARDDDQRLLRRHRIPFRLIPP
jgi:hypothetical protein